MGSSTTPPQAGPPPSGDITGLLQKMQADQQAAPELIALVYGELRRIAAAYMRSERATHTLQPTALIHEAWMRLADQTRVNWRDRAHFFGVSASMMRRVLVDHARERLAHKRGDGQAVLSIEWIEIADSPRKLEENDRRTLAMFFGVDESELGAPAANEVAVVQSGGRLAFAGKGRGAGGGGAARPVEAEWVDIPRLALGASAGPGTLALDEAESGRLRFSQRWLRTLGLDPGQLSVIEVAGDSMEPTLHDGDEILVDRSPRPWRDGIHVVRIDEVLLVKRLEIGRAHV